MYSRLYFPEDGNISGRNTLQHIFNKTTSRHWGTRWHSWLRHCATSWKVAGSIPDGVIGIFHWHNPSGRIMVLGLTQPLTEMSTRNISWEVKVAGAYGWQPYHLHVPNALKSGRLNLLEPLGSVQACNAIMILFIAGVVSGDAVSPFISLRLGCMTINKQQIQIHISTESLSLIWQSCSQPANGEHRDLGHRLHQGVLYCRNVKQLFTAHR